MSRAGRLLDLIQSLRRRRYAVSGRLLAEELGVSLRTLYRDIATLQAQGVPVEGEAGVGFILRQGFTLPPLMFTTEEIEAIVLGARWVLERGDDRLAMASRNALAKIGDVVREEMKVVLSYRDLKDRRTERVVWPFAMAYYDQVLVVMAWCESRQDYRHFRTDRIEDFSVSASKYPRSRLDLLREWQEKTGIPFDKYDF